LGRANSYKKEHEALN